MAPLVVALMQSRGSRLVVATGLVTAMTLVVVGVVLVAATPIGCGPATALGLKTISGRCGEPVSTRTFKPTPSPAPGASPAPSQSPTPSAVPTSSPAASAMPPDNGPASSAYPPYFPPTSDSAGNLVPALGLRCSLPVYIPTGTLAPSPGAAGFLVFPGGTFITDPASNISPLPTSSPNPASPSPVGWEGLTPPLSYDRAFSKWLPVPASWVSPDGSRYAYPTANAIYVQNVPSNTHLVLGEGQAWSIVAVLEEGVYASAPDAAGLWWLPYSGSPRQISARGYWEAATAEAAYGTEDRVDPLGAPNTGIIKLDQLTGAISRWFARANSQDIVVGLDRQGHPIVQVYFGAYGQEIWMTTGPSTGIPMGRSGVWYQTGWLDNQEVPVSDSHGIWFAAAVPDASMLPSGSQNAGTFLFVPGSGTYGMSKRGVRVLGPCA